MKLSYLEFLEITGGGPISRIKDSPIMRHVFRNLVAHKVIDLVGSLPPAEDTPLSDRVSGLEQRMEQLEMRVRSFGSPRKEK